MPQHGAQASLPATPDPPDATARAISHGQALVFQGGGGGGGGKGRGRGGEAWYGMVSSGKVCVYQDYDLP